jgi:hypothetical protein
VQSDGSCKCPGKLVVKEGKCTAACSPGLWLQPDGSCACHDGSIPENGDCPSSTIPRPDLEESQAPTPSHATSEPSQTQNPEALQQSPSYQQYYHPDLQFYQKEASRQAEVLAQSQMDALRQAQLREQLQAEAVLQAEAAEKATSKEAQDKLKLELEDLEKAQEEVLELMKQNPTDFASLDKKRREIEYGIRKAQGNLQKRKTEEAALLARLNTRKQEAKVDCGVANLLWKNMGQESEIPEDCCFKFGIICQDSRITQLYAILPFKFYN